MVTFWLYNSAYIYMSYFSNDFIWIIFFVLYQHQIYRFYPAKEWRGQEPLMGFQILWVLQYFIQRKHCSECKYILTNVRRVIEVSQSQIVQARERKRVPVTPQLFLQLPPPPPSEFLLSTSRWTADVVFGCQGRPSGTSRRGCCPGTWRPSSAAPSTPSPSPSPLLKWAHILQTIPPPRQGAHKEQGEQCQRRWRACWQKSNGGRRPACLRLLGSIRIHLVWFGLFWSSCLCTPSSPSPRASRSQRLPGWRGEQQVARGSSRECAHHRNCGTKKGFLKVR